MRYFIAVVAAVAAYFLLWPVAVEPLSWQAQKAPRYQAEFAVNHLLADFTPMTLAGQSGPEGVVVDERGTVYATTEQGGIVRWPAGELQGKQWLNTGGRPLGIALGENDDFWVADAFLGLLHISAQGQQTLVLDNVGGDPIRYANDVVLARGKVYMSDSTRRFSAKAYNSTYKASLVDIMEHGYSGQVIAFDPNTGQAQIVMTGLSFANGIAVDADQQFLLINETSEYRVWKYWLAGEKAGQSEVIVDNLPGFPDNIYRGQDGRFWLGFTSPRLAMVDWLADKPALRKVVQRLPAFIRPKASYYGHVIAIDADGNVVKNLQDPAAGYPLTTGVVETEQHYFISSLIAPVLARLDK